MAERVWNPARDALLRQLVNEGCRPVAAVAPLAALPGLPITKAKQVSDRMHALGITLSPEHHNAALRAANQDDGRITYTTARTAHLRATWPTETPKREILAQLNAMPGKPIRSLGALICHASKLGLRRPKIEPEAARRRASTAERPPSPPAPAPVVEHPAPRPSPALADAAIARRLEGARKALAERKDPALVARHHRLALHEVYRLVGELRRERMAA